MSEASSIRVVGRNLGSQRLEESSIPKEFLRVVLCDVNGDPIDMSSEPSFADNEFEIYGSDDGTKKLSFDVDSEVSTGEERVVKIQDSDGTMALMMDWSTTEKVHPGLMEDGETAYYKIVNLGAGPNTSNYTDVAHGISNLGTVIKGWTTWDKGDGGSNAASTFELAPDEQIKIYVGDTYVRTVATADKRDRSGKAYLIYTKTA